MLHRGSFIIYTNYEDIVYAIIVLSVIILVGLVSVPAFAQDDLVTVTTDKTSYSNSETVLVTGKVVQLLAGFPISVTFIAPNGNVVAIEQVEIDPNNTFHTKINLKEFSEITRGTYTIEAQYGTQNRIDQTYIHVDVDKTPKPIDTPKPVKTETTESTPTEKGQVPVWMKNSAKWWADKSISDSEFIASIEHMIKIRKIKVSDISQPVSKSLNSIPDWVRNTAKWWSEDKITDTDFIKGIEYLIKSGIVVMPKPVEALHPNILILSESELGEGWHESDATKQQQCKDCDDVEKAFFKDIKMVILGVAEFPTTIKPSEYFDTIIPEEDEVLTTFSNDKIYCLSWVEPKGIVTCIVGKFRFTASTTEESGNEFVLMDKMLGKYYNKMGSEFNFSTFELSKNPIKVITAKDITYEQKLNSLFSVEVIDCSDSAGGNYVEWKGSITSDASEKVDVKIILTGIDINDKIVTFQEHYVTDLYPDQTQYFERLLDKSPDFDSCSYKIESVR